MVTEKGSFAQENKRKAAQTVGIVPRTLCTVVLHMIRQQKARFDVKLKITHTARLVKGKLCFCRCLHRKLLSPLLRCNTEARLRAQLCEKYRPALLPAP